MPTPTSTSTSIPTATDPSPNPAFAEREHAATVSSRALDLVRDELLALEPRALVPVNVDVGAASFLVIGAAAEIQSYRTDLVELCGEAMAKSIDRLELLARAALHAHARYRLMETGADVVALSKNVAEVRDALLAEVRALVARKILGPGVLGELAGTNGYVNQCIDVLQLVSILRDDWDAIEDETGIGRPYVDRAEGLANALATAVSVRDQGGRSPAADLRQRAFTLLSQTYDDARRMITFLRWKEGDADRIAPSFFRGRGAGRRRRTEGADEVSPSPAPGDAATDAVVRPGMPGASPFVEG